MNNVIVEFCFTRPPSLNRLWKRAKGNRLTRTKEYNDWIANNPIEEKDKLEIDFPCRVEIDIFDLSKRSDVDNRQSAIKLYLEESGVVKASIDQLVRTDVLLDDRCTIIKETETVLYDCTPGEQHVEVRVCYPKYV